MANWVAAVVAVNLPTGRGRLAPTVLSSVVVLTRQQTIELLCSVRGQDRVTKGQQGLQIESKQKAGSLSVVITESKGS